MEVFTMGGGMDKGIFDFFKMLIHFGVSVGCQRLLLMQQ